MDRVPVLINSDSFLYFFDVRAGLIDSFTSLLCEQVNNARQGRRGTLVFQDGSQYVGDFRANKIHGHGMMHNADGSK